MAGGAFLAERYDLGLLAPSGPRLALARLQPQDADRLGAVFAAMDPWSSYPYPASSLAAYFAAAEPGAPRFGLFAEDEIAGVAGLRLAWLRGPYLQFLGVMPAYQGRGLGSAVMEWIEREARAHGERNVWVLASDFNARAIKFYERQGFTRVAALDALVTEERTEILMRKRL